MSWPAAFEGRPEYDVNVAANPDGIVRDITDLIDGLLCETKLINSSGLYVSSSADSCVIRRQFSSLEVVGNAGTDTVANISYAREKKPSRSRYTVALTTLVELDTSAVSQRYDAYHLDVYPNGPVQAMIDEDGIEFTSDGEIEVVRNSRRLTTYDLDTLQTKLASLAYMLVLHESK